MICKTCDTDKDEDEYYKGRRSCKQCVVGKQKKNYHENDGYRKQKAWQLENWYGITIEQYDSMVAEQNNNCAICERDLTLNVDHDHDTGEVRGLLCTNCNRAIGLLNDNPEWCQRASTYLYKKLHYNLEGD